MLRTILLTRPKELSESRLAETEEDDDASLEDGASSHEHEGEIDDNDEDENKGNSEPWV